MDKFTREQRRRIADIIERYNGFKYKPDDHIFELSGMVNDLLKIIAAASVAPIETRKPAIKITQDWHKHPTVEVYGMKTDKFWGHISGYGSFVEAWVAKPYAFRPIEESSFFASEGEDSVIEGKRYIHLGAGTDTLTAAKQWVLDTIEKLS